MMSWRDPVLRGVLVLSSFLALGACDDPTRSEPVVGLSVAPDSVVLLVGRSGTLFVDLSDASGQPITHKFSLSSSAPGTVAVDSGGTIRGVAAGTAVVTVRAGLKSVDVPVRVVDGDRFRVRVLPTLGGDTSWARALNNRREVVGSATVPGNAAQHPFLWQRGAMTDLGVPAGDTGAEALDISSRTEVVGVAHRPHPNPPLRRPVYSAWRWRSGVRSPIEPPVPTLIPSDATYIWLGDMGVNDAGEVVLQYTSVISGGGTHVHARTYLARGATFTELQVPGSEPWVDYTAAGISRDGTAAFTRWSDASYGGVRPVAHLWKDGQVTAGPQWMAARAINDDGLVVGACGEYSPRVGCTWDGTTRRELPGTMEAYAVNAQGDVLARAADWTPVLVRGATLIRLADAVGPEWEILSASDLNDWGEIAATGKSRTTGEVRALLLTPS